MKLPHTPRGGRLLLLGSTCLGATGMAFAQQEDIPRGKLSVDSSMVRVGANANLTWQIRYDVKIDDLINVVDPKIISLKDETIVRVRVIGSGKAAVKSNNGHGNNIDGVDSSNPGQGVGGPTGKKNSGADPSGTVDDEKNTTGSASGSDMTVEVQCAVNQAGWATIFHGLQSLVVPTEVVFESPLRVGDTLCFASRAFTTSWQPLYSTATSSQNVLVLKNGDPAPSQIANRQYGQIQAFIKPYLSTNGKTVKIGARDLLVLFELDKSNPNAAGFDYQDIGVLVTFD